MSADVPLARSAGEVTPTTWDPEVPRLWDALFGVCLVGVLSFVFAASEAPTTGRWLAAGLLATMAIWYALFGRRIAGKNAPLRHGLLFQGVLLALFVATLSLAGSVSFLLIAICPLTYMTVRIWPAHVIVTLYAFAPAALAASRGEWSALGVLVPLGAVIVTVSVVIAITTHRAERISAERARLIEELNATRAEVARLSKEAGAAEERQRLAGEIHDTVAQGLSSVVMLVEAADAELTTDPEKARAHLALAARTARENMDEARAIVAALTPSPLATATLVDAIDRLSARHQDAATAVSFVLDGEPRPLPTNAEVVLLRVAQESLTNVRKHAAATRVSVRLSYRPDLVALELADDGRGFDVTGLRHGYGLDAMTARVEQLGGRLTIHSEPGRGTAIRTEIDA